MKAAVDPAVAAAAVAAPVQGSPAANQGVPVAQTVFTLCPGQLNLNRSLNYSKQGDVKLYKSATTTEPFNQNRLFNIDNAGLMQFMMEV
jgi:hypothetical protein